MSERPSFGDDIKLAAEIMRQLQAAGIEADDPDLPTLLENECDGPERVRRLIRAARWTEAQSKALGEMMAEMRDRKARMEKKAQSLRDASQWALGEMGLSKLAAPDFSLSIGPGKPRVLITDEAAIPDAYFRVKREPDKTALAAALQAGPVNGAVLSNPEPTLTIRGK